MSAVTEAVDDADVPLTDALMALWFVRTGPDACFIAFVEQTNQCSRLSLCWRYDPAPGETGTRRHWQRMEDAPAALDEQIIAAGDIVETMAETIVRSMPGLVPKIWRLIRTPGMTTAQMIAALRMSPLARPETLH